MTKDMDLLIKLDMKTLILSLLGIHKDENELGMQKLTVKNSRFTTGICRRFNRISLSSTGKLRKNIKMNKTFNYGSKNKW